MNRLLIIIALLAVACKKSTPAGPPLTIHVSSTVTYTGTVLTVQGFASDSLPGLNIFGNVHYEWWYRGAMVDSVNFPTSFPGHVINDQTQRPDWQYYHTYPDTALSIHNMKLTEAHILNNTTGRVITVTY